MLETGSNIDNNPLVSVIIPLYNAEKYIAETIQNVLEQTYQPIEVIIIDDGSTDKSPSIAKLFEGENVKVFSQTNKGASAARNYGLKEAKGAFIQFLDADDLLSADKIEVQVAILRSNDLTQVCFCNTVHFFDGDNHKNSTVNKTDLPYLTDYDKPVDLLMNLYSGGWKWGMITIHSWLTPSDLIKKAGYWNESLTVDDDGEFFCRVLLFSSGVKFSRAGTNYYRKYKSKKSLSSMVSESAYKSGLEAIKLKEKILNEKVSPEIWQKAISYQYFQMATSAFPYYKEISTEALLKVQKFGFKHRAPVLGGLITETIKLIFGWKVAKLFIKLRHKL